MNDERSVLFEALFADWCDVDEGGTSDVPTCVHVGATGTIGHVASDDLGRQPGPNARLRGHWALFAVMRSTSHGEDQSLNTTPERLPADSLTIVDRGFLSARILIPLARDGANRHWLIRTKKNQRWRVLQRLGPRDALVEMNVSSEARKKDPALSDRHCS